MIKPYKKEQLKDVKQKYSKEMGFEYLLSIV